jgi:putative cell wall-binding protein
VQNFANDITPGTVQVGRGTPGDTAVDTATAGPVVIPELVQGSDGFEYRPVSIAPNAFYRCLKLTAVVIPSQVSSIGTQAFACPYQGGDSQFSSLQTVVFSGDLTRTSISADAFDNLPALTTVVHGGKKGNFGQFGSAPAQTRYYTVSFYTSPENQAAGIVERRILIKEGSPADAPSPLEYWAGTSYLSQSSAYQAAPTGSVWRFEPGILGANRAIQDSLYAVARSMEENVFENDVTVSLGGGSTTLPCTFSVILDEDGLPTGFAQVGRGVSGQTAVNASFSGVVQIPAEVVGDDGTPYPVVRVASYAFGADDPSQAAELSEIQLPVSVTTIGRAAFYNCTNLNEVAIPSAAVVASEGYGGLATIEPYAFAETSGLAYIDVPEGLLSIGDNAFKSSGLKAIEIPDSVTELGRAAFDSCAALKEVVFGGIMALPLTPLDGLAFSSAQTDAEPINGAAPIRLSLLPDFVFANCGALQRLVFEPDVHLLQVSSVAFENATALAAVVFNERGVGLAIASNPTMYVTASYFDSTEDRDALERSGYLCQAAGHPLEPFDSSLTYAGFIPQLPEGFTWRYSRDPAMPVGDSCTAYRSKAGYLLDTSTVDGAFVLSFKVNGEDDDVAVVDDYVQVSVTEKGAAGAVRLRVINALDSSVIVDTNALAASFLMPDAPLVFEVEAGLDLRLYRQPLNSPSKELGTLSLAQMQELAQTTPLVYSAWNTFGEREMHTTTSYLPITELLAHFDQTFEPDDSLVFRDADGYTTAMTYQGLMRETRYFYPGFATGDPGGAEAVQPVLALNSSTRVVSPDNSEGVPKDEGLSMTDAYQLLFGQTATDFSNRRDTSGELTPQIVSLTFIKGTAQLDDCQVSGIEPFYYYTSMAIEPHPTVTDVNGNRLVEGRDYSIAWADNIKGGLGKVVLTGIGYYQGSRELAFSIRHAQSLAGADREEAARTIVLDAYPSGSNGAIVVSSAGFADALSASGLAGMLDYPIVLTSPSALGVHARATLEALSNGRYGFEVIIVGGPASVFPETEEQIMALLGQRGYVVRVTGADRFEVSQEVFFHGMMAGQWSDTMVVATGLNYPDALSIAPYAASSGAPLFLCNGQSLGATMLNDMRSGGFTRAVVVGGEASVSAEVFRSLEDIVGAGQVVRLGGEDRYQASLNIARWALTQPGSSINGVAIATGQNFPDALAGSPLLAQSGSPLLLADSTNTTTLALLGENRTNVHHLRFLGGLASVPQQVRESATDALQWDRSVLE